MSYNSMLGLQQSCINQIIEESGTSGQRPLNICVIGTFGAGKSSFINTVAAALNGIRWREHAAVGDYGGMRGVTPYMQRFAKCCQSGNPKYKNISLPTLIDVPGFEHDEDERVSTEEILRLIFFGKIGHEDSLQTARDYCMKHGFNRLKIKYSQTNVIQMFNKIDRIIFVATAREKLPEDLIQCVVNAAQPTGSIRDKFKRSIPIFGVLTHASPMENEKIKDLDKIARRFRQALGINSHRLLKCSNYCDDVNGGGCATTIRPELDIPVLEFLVQVFDRSLSVLHDHEIYEDAKNCPFCYWIFLGIVAIAIFFGIFVLPNINSNTNRYHYHQRY